MTPKQVIDRLKWDKRYRLENAEIWFWDRCSPTGERGIKGSEILDVREGFLILKNSRIPLYKIFKIVHGNEVLFERKK